MLQSDSEQYIKVNGEKLPFKVTQSFSFNSCGDVNVTTFKMKTKNVLTKFEHTEKIIRYGTSSKLVPLVDKDPCLVGATTCTENSYCIADKDSFKCACKSGYQSIKYDRSDNFQCVDINECSTGTHYCSKNAQCINEEGSFSCRCDAGYSGDGHNCTPDNDCGGECDLNADCIAEGEESYCLCKPGYDGDGEKCELIEGGQDCRYSNYCSPYGECVENNDGNFACKCLNGYEGDGYTCDSNNTVDEGTTISAPVVTTNGSVKKYAKQCEDGKCWCPEGYLEETTYCYADPDYRRQEEDNGK